MAIRDDWLNCLVISVRGHPYRQCLTSLYRPATGPGVIDAFSGVVYISLAGVSSRGRSGPSRAAEGKRLRNDEIPLRSGSGALRVWGSQSIRTAAAGDGAGTDL